MADSMNQLGSLAIKCFFKQNISLSLIHYSCFALLFGLSVAGVTAAEISNQRLSTILENSAYPKDRSFGEIKLQGTMWQSPAEIATQKQQKENLLTLLSGLKANNERFSSVTHGINQLESFIKALPVTGRVLLPNQDYRWLAAHPPSDPVISSQDKLIIPAASRLVTVIRDDGRICQVPFRGNVYAVHYTSLCDIKDSALSNWAWVIQADGTYEQVGLSSWNQNSQNQPGPGSWIWAPSSPNVFRQTIDALPWTKKRHFTDEFSDEFAKLLSTQGPSDAKSLQGLFNADQTIIDSPKMLVESQAYTPKEAHYFSSDWGSIGLMQTPSSRMLPAGSGLFNYTHVTPYSNYNFLLQPFESLEATFRYTSDTNNAYGSQELSGNQSYLDKSVDFKLRLLKENTHLPQLAVGIRDVTGTGLFAGEYVVGNKRFGDFDFSLGLAWGYMGNRGNVKNPLSILGSGFSTRPTADVGQGGNFSFGTYFHGPTALIGGVQYQTPISKLSLKMELDGNNYQNEPFGYALTQKSPINFGAVYRWDNAHITLGVERGNKAMISFTIFDNLSKLSTPKLFEPAPIPVSYKPISAPINVINIDPFQNQLAASNPSSATTQNLSPTSPLASQEAKKIVSPLSQDALEIMRSDISTQSGWRLRKVIQNKNRWVVTLDAVTGVYMKDRINRVISVLHRDAPESIHTFVIQYQNHQIKLIQQSINRQAWMLKQQQLLPPSYAKLSEPQVSEYPSQVLLSSMREGSSSALENINSSNPSSVNYELPQAKRLSGSVGIGYQQNIGGPDGYLFAFSGVGDAQLRLWDGAWINGVAKLRLIDNFDKFSYDAPSNLPRVRTNLREYMTTSRATIPNLQATQVVKVSDSHYVSAYGGLLEMMFGGVGAEWLYRPLNSTFAVGVDVNQVKQRDVDQRFTFQDYQVFTGHLTSYWDTGWHDVLVKGSVGQYLAGDRGFTLDLSRSFSNGVRMGAYFTKTNVSAQDFGEGSFDKGIYVAIPFDVFFTKHSSSVANLVWSPLIRDGGAKLNRAYPLYDLTTMRDQRAMNFGPPAPK